MMRLGRRLKRFIMFTLDGVAFALSGWLGLAIATADPSLGGGNTWLAIPLLVLIGTASFYHFRVYMTVLRFLGGRVAWSVIKAALATHLAWGTFLWLAGPGVSPSQAISAAIVSLLAVVTGTIGGRYAARTTIDRQFAAGHDRRRVVIYGISRQSVELARSMYFGVDYTPVAFIERNPEYLNSELQGLPVCPPAQLAELVREDQVSMVVIVAAGLGANELAALLREFSGLSLSVRILPDLPEVLEGAASVNLLRSPRFEDLVERMTAEPDPALLEGAISGKRILVTGGAGSIGSELCRLIASLGPERLVVADYSEAGLALLRRRLIADGMSAELVLANVADERDVEQLLGGGGFDLVLHSAAFKHVDICEDNPLQAIRNNVLSTYLVTRSAIRNGVSNFILISTDKAVRPAGVMGATKAWSEIIVQSLSQSGDLSNGYSAVRFGNVFYSSGSVVPLFEEQIAAGGPVTITDHRMERYFMTLREAAELIVQAASLQAGGEVFALEMGKPIRIADLARNLVLLSGKSVRSEDNPDGEIEMRETGLRPGEKLREDLFFDPALVSPTSHPGIFRMPLARLPESEVEAAITELRACLDQADEQAARKVLFDFLQ